ncbi:hypothetical protein Fcan01_26797 [Folsomia candida]|uniref:Uncharacterized protein n=1 Tax=Folsomia candida TaxID=158441 RepID=A0A226CYG8_FOLCA|nr:hypothetical protein Fcan01_26797 [Folsomia candida]
MADIIGSRPTPLQVYSSRISYTFRTRNATCGFLKRFLAALTTLPFMCYTLIASVGQNLGGIPIRGQRRRLYAAAPPDAGSVLRAAAADKSYFLYLQHCGAAPRRKILENCPRRRRQTRQR